MSTAITLEMHRTSVCLTAVKANRSQQGQATVSGRVISGSGILTKNRCGTRDLDAPEKRDLPKSGAGHGRAI